MKKYWILICEWPLTVLRVKSWNRYSPKISSLTYTFWDLYCTREFEIVKKNNTYLCRVFEKSVIIWNYWSFYVIDELCDLVHQCYFFKHFYFHFKLLVYCRFHLVHAISRLSKFNGVTSFTTFEVGPYSEKSVKNVLLFSF